MGVTSNEAVLPPPLRGSKEGSFAYKTVKDRWPTIVSKLVNHFSTKHRELIEAYGPDAKTDVKSILAHLSEMRYRMMTNKPLELLNDHYTDVVEWNRMIQERLDVAEKEEKKCSWFDEEWLFVECYLYRRIFGVVYDGKAMRHYDFFSDQKKEGYESHKDQVIDALAQLQSHLSVSSTPETDDVHLCALIKQSIWGNRCDLSLSAGEGSVHNQNQEALAQMDHLLIVNDLTRVLILFKKMRNKSGTSRRIDIVLDNAGMELVSDMVLAEFMLASNMVDEVIFHVKAIPWFVSDVTMEDWEWTVEQFKALNSKLGPVFSKFMEKRVREGSIKLNNNLFWISPHRFCDMKKHAPELYDDLTKSRLIIFKGDLNYRKLVGDREWPFHTPMQVAVQGFNPAPILALRTLKAETLAGLLPQTAAHFMAKEDKEWLVSGTHAVIQLID